MCADGGIVSQVHRRACLVALLLHPLGVLFGLDEPLAELAIPQKKLLILSFKFAASIHRQFRFGVDPGSTPQQRCDDDQWRRFKNTSQCVV